MKKWFGGTLLLALAVILGILFFFAEKQQEPQPRQKQSAYEFFRNYLDNESHVEKNTSIAKSFHVQTVREKPHFVDFEGLNELYAMSNITKEDSKVLLVWNQMRSLLSRSDAFPETAQGIKEASIAWKDLLATVQKEKVIGFADNSSESSHCSFFVNMLNNTFSNNEIILEVPCGLVEDSSFTVIGVPEGHDGSFQIELIGSQFPGEPEPSTVLYYNVSLPSEDLAKYPVIIQNTRTAESGWGEPERCPGHHPSNHFKVDGLVRCNEKLDRTVIKEKLNGSGPGHENLTDSSSGSNHINFNFPFTDGNLFTSTLWVGLEGFHMTVNGRHETSFPYRKKLEPWLVSRLKVTGGLDVLSVIANGLPVTEDLDLAIDIENLRAPPVARRRVILLIGVFSTGNNFERRMALRRSWMQYAAVRSGEVAVRFFIGLHKNMQVNLQLWREAQAYGDIQIMPFVDYYSLITLKTVAICIMGVKIVPAKYIMKTDDDAFIRVDEILSRLKERKTSDGLLYGLIAFESSPHRDSDSKWFISPEEWPHDSYPPWAHGPGYIISRDIAKFIVQAHHENALKLFKLEDVAMGIWIDEYKKNGRKVEYSSDERFYNAGCEDEYILAHYQNPRMLLCLWEKLQKEHQAHCCE
ncbi:hypothetical protein ACHQM5_026128 [Ranunculus cassubicifolius]